VVLNFEETLVHSKWSRERGWMLRKRPHVDAFLVRLKQAGYEIVIFASTQQFVRCLLLMAGCVLAMAALSLFCLCLCVRGALWPS